MGDLEFGLTMIVVGMGGTFAVLCILAVLMNVLKKIFPSREENN